MEKDFSNRKNIVIKLGTSSIAPQQFLNKEIMEKIVGDILFLKGIGAQVSIVSSGAAVKGRQILEKYNGIENETAIDQRIYAAVGQSHLVHAWENELLKHKIHAMQLLIDYDDFKNRERLSNIQSIYETALSRNCIPIINGNTALGSRENDKLSAFTTTKLGNDLLIIYTSKDGIYKNEKVVGYPTSYDREFYDKLENSVCGAGGIESKLEAALICNEKKIPCIISNVKYKIGDVLRGEAPRSVFLNQTSKPSN